ncbi:hypothetical protein CBR_g31139 [Chara braunii]|uniref:Coenzyme Q-binding protein COQ10 START domain-containing protein n=1 Tax=Chara braunii TaxID=69332 RepID=A0A388LEE1_CHABU|nr:hypothetical protein CBR_g31139 [Chara braunii]|eukprot:GBG80680.1 hypothetical protein CBR_g31139 [Chara braunii]
MNTMCGSAVQLHNSYYLGARGWELYCSDNRNRSSVRQPRGRSGVRRLHPASLLRWHYGCNSADDVVRGANTQKNNSLMCSLDQRKWRKGEDSSTWLCRSSTQVDGLTSVSGWDEQGGAVVEEAVKELTTGNVGVVINKTGLNSRRVVAKVHVQAPLRTVWDILTDYSRLGEFFPNLAVNELLELRPKGARLLQVGEQDVALGVKFRAKAVVDVEEDLSMGKHDIHFRIVEGDFQMFEGTWRMEEGTRSKDRVEELSTTLAAGSTDSKPVMGSGDKEQDESQSRYSDHDQAFYVGGDCGLRTMSDCS